jgi:hypothetical protein
LLADFVEHVAVRGVQLLEGRGEGVTVLERKLSFVEQAHNIE